ncbi:hypothetical protein, partial [Streptomyces sp. t39]|uniref:hypothetical protein n=1 Tax=Streptomyces sp. t39 TaxID=1828156 RepID=UPI0012CC64AD
LSPPLARAWRYSSRLFLQAYTICGTVRYSTSGPNWMRPLAKALHIIYRPAALLVAASGTWGWLNRWMYTHTSGGQAEVVDEPAQGDESGEDGAGDDCAGKAALLGVGGGLRLGLPPRRGRRRGRDGGEGGGTGRALVGCQVEAVGAHGEVLTALTGYGFGHGG